MRHLQAILLLLTIASPAAAGERPNILFILTDDHASHAISAYGSTINTTPHLDRLANEGMLFRNCFVANSICTPSRATILTGKHSHLNGAFNVGDKFDGTQQTFPKLLQQAGYQTAIIGKWHLGHGGTSDPAGFDYWNVLVGQGPYYNPPMLENGKKKQYSGYTTDVISDLTLKWLHEQRDKSKPFFLACQHKAPHREWQPGPKHLNDFKDVTITEPPDLFDDYSNRASAARLQEMTIANHMRDLDMALEPPDNLTPEQLKTWNDAFEKENAEFRAANLTGDALTRWRYQRYIKNYLRCVASVDDGVGELLKYLDESGLAKNTVVIYSSDQGFYLGDHGWYDKRFMYEQSLRTPLLVRWPGVIKAGAEEKRLAQNLDFAQTILELAGVTAPADMQGMSLAPLLKGEASQWRDAIYYHYYDFPAVHSVRPHFGLRTDRHKLVRYHTLDEWELFDLEKDPREMRSVYADPAYAQVRADLEVKLKSLQQQYKDDNPTADAATLKKQARIRK